MTQTTYSLEQVTLIARGRRHAAEGTGRKIRTEAHVTVAQIASLVGVYPADVWRWERGAIPRSKHALAWAQVLDHLEREVIRPKS